MIEVVRRKLRRRRAALARGPLTALVRWCAYHAMVPLAGRRLTQAVVDQATAAIARGLRDVADRGALLFFGIRDAAELGPVPVRLVLISDGEPPLGRALVNEEEVVAWIERGGARSAGWTAPRRLAADDL